MSLHFSANQYDKNFQPTLLQNWEVPRRYREWMVNKGMRDCRPRPFAGFTQIVANDKGHLLSGVKRSRESPWGTHIGTWDMPLKIPGNCMTNGTARTENAVFRLERLKSDGDIVLGGKLKQCKMPSPLPVKADKDADKFLSPKMAGASTQLLSGNGVRSGAMNPEPMSSVLAPASPGIRPTEKPCTPNIDWPRPASRGSRAQSANPRMSAQCPLPAIQPGTPSRPEFKWPSPRAEEQQMAA